MVRSEDIVHGDVNLRKMGACDIGNNYTVAGYGAVYHLMKNSNLLTARLLLVKILPLQILV